MALPSVTPMELVRQKTPFDHPDWLFEIKYDGFRSLAYIEDGCKLVSRNEFHYQRFKDLAESIVSDLDVSNVIFDGEIVCLDDKGHSRFYDLMGNRGVPIFALFDVLWLNGEDLRDLPLSDRKATLREIVPESPERMLYVDHIQEHGTALYEQCCSLDLEGIVAKPKISPYREVKRQTTWIKVKNPDYSQAAGRQELFNKRR